MSNSFTVSGASQPAPLSDEKAQLARVILLGHDLRAAVSDILGGLRMISHETLDDTTRLQLERMRAAGEVMARLIEEGLDIVAEQTNCRQTFQTARLLYDLEMRWSGRAQEKGLGFHVALAPDVPPMLEIDRLALERILANMLSNAIKYTDRGGVLVGVRRRGDRAWLDVLDTGVGIAPADRSRIFDEFQRIGREGGAPGMGLGLSIVRRACAKLGHAIALDSEPGRGTAFRVSLPLVAAGVASPRPDAVLPGPSLRGRVALVIENDDAMRLAYQLMLRERLGMVVRVSGGTAEALAVMGDEPPDAVIADYNLDNDDTGLQAIRALRAAAGQAVPAILVSARRDPEISRASLELGVPMLEKPIRPEELQLVLQRILA